MNFSIFAAEYFSVSIQILCNFQMLDQRQRADTNFNYGKFIKKI